jgi:hypothetical protein
MAKSRTRKKSDKDKMPQEVSQMVDLAADYIQHWTKTELNKIQNSQSPICIPIKSGYKIGHYTLKTYSNKKCDLFDSDEKLIHTFEDKRSAVLYTIYTIKKQYKTADNIRSLDIEINKNYTDTQAWQNHIAKARKRKDYDTVDIRQSRLEIAEKCLSHARNEISKIYLTAKYNKIWDL